MARRLLNAGSGHDDQTEVLTRVGWKLFAHVAKDDELATVDPTTSVLRYEKPAQLISYPYKGPMIRGTQRYVDFRVSPNHGMIERHWNHNTQTLYRHYEFRAAKDLGWYCGLLTHVKWAGSKIASNTYALPGIDTKHKAQRSDLPLPMTAWLHFLGIYLAEGTLAPRSYKEHRIQIAATKPRERKFIIATLREIGIETSHNRSDRFTFSNHRLYEAVDALGLHVHAPDKFVPSFVFEQSAMHIREFLLGHFSGDGCDNGSGVRRHYTSSKRLAEDLQRLIFLSGDEAHVKVREPRKATMKDGRKIIGRHPEYCTSVCERRSSSLLRAEHITEEQYDGEVFCAEVSSHHTLVTKRNGRILVSGDSTSNKIATVPRTTFRRRII